MITHCLLPLSARLLRQFSQSSQVGDKRNKHPQESDKQEINFGMRTRNELYLSVDTFASKPKSMYATVRKSSPAGPEPGNSNGYLKPVDCQNPEKGLAGECSNPSRIGELPSYTRVDSANLLCSANRRD